MSYKTGAFNPNTYYNLEDLLPILQGKAKTLQSLYLQDKEIQYLDKSLAIYGDIDVLISHMRQSYQNYQDKVTFAKQTKDIYTEAVQVNLLLYKQTNNQKAIEQAFYYSEKSKANVLQELLQKTSINSFSDLPEKILSLEKTLKSKRAFYQSQLVAEQSKDSIDIEKTKTFENQLFNVSRSQDSLIDVLENSYPKYFQLKYQKNNNITVSYIQEQLDDKTTLLEFFTADSLTYAFSLSKHDIAVKTLKTPELAKQVEDLKETIVSRDMSNYSAFAYVLHNTLIGPLKEKLIGDKLIIIPDGSLWHLNFELLLTQQSDANNDTRSLSYLLRDYAISYANTVNLLFKPFKTNKHSIKVKDECLAFSFSDSINLASVSSKTMRLGTFRDSKNDLPGTRTEIKAISKIVNGLYYYGNQAIESNFKQNVNEYRLLHLALHGDVDNENPENSRLYFTKSKDTLEDNVLYSHELFALNIPAELTVLSACNTGTGKIANGEGVMSMGTAFQYAGTKSLLLSAWEVTDYTAPILIEGFYNNLANNMDKSKALQKAKLDFLKTANLNQTAPFYWGNFYLLGDNAPIKIDKAMDSIYWFVLVGIGMVIAFVFYRRRRAK